MALPPPPPPPPPPSFNSFPILRRPPPPPPPRSRPPPYERSDQSTSHKKAATDFLDAIQLEMKLDPSSSKSSKSSKRANSGAVTDDSKDRSRSKDKKIERHPEGQEQEEQELKLSTRNSNQMGAKLQKVNEPRVFSIDLKGDDFNLRYGGLYKGDIPRYRRRGAGRVMGLNSGLRITKDSAYSGKGLEVASNTRYITPRYTHPRSAQHANDRHYKRITLTPRTRSRALGEATVDGSDDDDDPFLPSSVDPSRFVGFIPDPIPVVLEFEAGQDYRSITGPIKPSDFDPPSDQEEDDLFDIGITGGESLDDYLKRRNVELDRELRDDPKNVDAWIAFVEFQDEVASSGFAMGGGGGGTKGMTKPERRSTCEIKLSILDRALAVPENRGSEVLLLAYLQAMAEVDTPQVVLKKWASTLKEHPGLTGLWIEYISFRQTSWANFQIRDVVAVFEECFLVIMNAAAKELIGSHSRETLEGNAIYLLLRCCLMLRQSGYSERALATFQTMIELNFYRPDVLSLPSTSPRESETVWRERVFVELETFWDSEVPRIGETGGAGWKNSLSDMEPLLSTTSTTIPPIPDSTENPFERWAQLEALTTVAQPRPARTMDPDVDDDIDPFRVVLFDDVRDFLIVVHSTESKRQLAYAFLTFLGLPFVPPDYPTSSPFQTDPFIHSELVERPEGRERFWPPRRSTQEVRVPYELIGGEAMEPVRKSGLSEPFATPFCATPVSIDLLFATKRKWFVTLTKAQLGHVDIEFARNVFSHLRSVVSHTLFDLDFLAFEACQSPKAAVKWAKQVLRDQRQNLILWDAYARIERQRGKVDDARAVYVTALSMYRSFAVEEQIDGPLLWHSWAEMEWEEGRAMLALKVWVASVSASEEIDLATLAKVNGDERPTPSAILRARQSFTVLLESAFQPNPPRSILRHRNYLAASFASFEYLSQGLASAVQVYERHLFRLDCAGATGSAEHEESLMMYVKLLYRHAEMGGGYKPGQLRDVLEVAMETFPHNSLFLSVFYSNELRMKIQNRVRRTLETSVLKEKSVTSEGWLFAIYAEAHLDARSMNVWGVRNLFDRAVENPRTRSSPSIWSLYIDFEIRNEDLSRAKALVYRAIRAIPWSKHLYLLPFSLPLRELYRSHELKEMHSLLLEKGLRLRTDLEVDGWTSDVDMAIGDGDDSDGGEGGYDVKPAEEIFRERKRLLPY